MRDYGYWLRTAGLVVLALTLVSAAFSATVVVKPSNMNGWIAAAFQGLDENATEPTYSFSRTIAPPYRDGLYMSLGFSVEPPNGTREEATNELWCGNNLFNGVKISDLTRLEYSTFTEFSGNLWESHTSCPVKLVLTIKTDGVPDNYPPEERTAQGPRNWLVLIFSPWDPGEGPGLRTYDRTPYGCWQTWDLLQSVWYVGMEPDDNNWQGWDEILANYPDATIEFPYSYAQNLAANNAYGGIATGIHDPWKAPYPDESRYSAATLTGTSMSFQVGARRTFDDDFGGAWWKEHVGFKGFVDMLTVGVDSVDTTFDFQADEAPSKFYATSNADAVRPMMVTAEQNFHFVVFGKVVWDPYEIYSPEFIIDDGSGALFKIKAPGAVVSPGDYVRAAGMLRSTTREVDDPNLPADEITTHPQPTLFSDMDHVTVLQPGF